MKTETKHTPGPWHIEREEWTEGNGLLICSPDGPVALIDPEPDEGPNTQDQANACLIAAAPAMYEALKSVQQALCLYHCQTVAKELQGKHIKACNIARAALALADGEQSDKEER